MPIFLLFHYYYHVHVVKDNILLYVHMCGYNTHMWWSESFSAQIIVWLRFLQCYILLVLTIYVKLKNYLHKKHSVVGWFKCFTKYPRIYKYPKRCDRKPVSFYLLEIDHIHKYKAPTIWFLGLASLLQWAHDVYMVIEKTWSVTSNINYLNYRCNH